MIGVLETVVDRLLALETSVFWGGVVSWITLSMACSAVASGKGQPPGVYFLVSLMFSPVIGFLFVATIANRRADELAALRKRLDVLEGKEEPPAAAEAITDPAGSLPPGGAPDGSPAARKEAASLARSILVAIALVVGMIAVIAWFGSGGFSRR